MPKKQFALDERTVVTIYKRKSSRSLRLTITPEGLIRVSIPRWAPYSAGLDFAASKRDWIEAQRQPRRLLEHGQAVGKTHRLHFSAIAGATKATGRVSAALVIVKHPEHLAATSDPVQKAAVRASIRALKAQAEQVLPGRLETMAVRHGFRYGKVTIKQLKSRWGSCDHQGNIVLSLFLMQLPWAYIDYVLLHELTHTRVMRHGPDFWQAMAAVLPEARTLKKDMRQFQPVLGGSSVS